LLKRIDAVQLLSFTRKFPVSSATITWCDKQIHWARRTYANLARPPLPSGRNVDGAGVNFACSPEHATKVDLCLFDSIEAKKRRQGSPCGSKPILVWHSIFPEILPATLRLTTFRALMNPPKGIASITTRFCSTPTPSRSDAASLGRCRFGYKWAISRGSSRSTNRDSAPFAPLAWVIDNSFTWGDDRLLRIPLAQDLIYELHVRGYTQLQCQDS